MKVVVDTNVIVRYLTWDDPEQAQASSALLESEHHLIIPNIVLCEVAWVLGRSYGLRRAEIHSTLKIFAETIQFETDKTLLEAAMNHLAAGGDFADGCLLAMAKASRAETLMTFDRALVKLAKGFARVPRS